MFARFCVVLVGVSLALPVVFAPERVEAQECRSEALDALARARRARSFQVDFARYRGAHDRRLDRLFRWVEREGEEGEEGDEVRWSTQFSWLGENYKFSDYTLCADGEERSAQLNGGWNGFAIETRNREWDSRIRLSVFEAGDGLSPDNLPRDSEGDVIYDDDAIGYGQLFWGVYVQATEWFGATVGSISDTERRSHIGTHTTSDGTESSTDVRINTVGEPNWYLSAALPKWDVSTDFVFGAADGLDVGTVQAAAIPTGVDGLDALAGAGYVGYEDTVLANLGARFRPVSFVETSLETSLEPVRLRSVVGRAELDWRHPYYPEIELLPGQTTDFLLGAEAGAFVEGSLFNSAYMEEVMGRTNVAGVIGGASAGFVSRPMAFNLEVYGGVNPAGYLTRIVDVVDKPLYGTRLVVRTGW
ncbi:MAG: hypothetical protein ACOCV2_08610 [Persicimonas sp.]